ncbi:MAG TPA: pirin family protein [Rhodospirillaceae bacterium]|nr:pirin family protein [Rhodospirillaceae bacterium]
MTVTVRPSKERGYADLGWLQSHHSFSFADYYDPRHMGFRALRVINEDVIEPGTGFDTHGHRDMEIVTYVVEGALEHRDSTGEHGVIRPGEVQHMSAGHGIRHSEFNPSAGEAVKLLQIWILPRQQGLAPGYRQKLFTPEDKHNRLCPIATGDGRQGSLVIQQDAAVYAACLEAGLSLSLPLADGRGAWMQLISGALSVNGAQVAAGDGVAIEKVGAVDITASSASEFLLFDLP